MFSDVLLTRLESLSPVVRMSSARAVALSKVDGEMGAAVPLTRTLLMHRNTLAPVSVLPPEILARIFHLVSLDGWSLFPTENLRWISVTQVCRHWRQVALDDSSLWVMIPRYQKSTAWISEVLARARNAPLVIALQEIPHAETLAMFPAHFAHTYEFRLHGPITPHLYDNIREICSLEAPALEIFDLGVYVSYPVAFFRAPFFNGMAPKLRTFSLTQIRVPWSFIPCGQLTRLKIIQYSEGEPIKEPIADGSSLGDSKSFLNLLINCPVLEVLVLEFCLPHGITRPSHVQAIHLPRLSYLSLGGSSSRVANVLEILKLPPSTTLCMRCSSENTTSYDDYRLLLLVSAHFHGPASVEIKGFKVTFDYVEPISFAAYTYLPTSTAYPSYFSEGHVNRGPALSLSFDAPFRANVDIFGRVCGMLPISDIEFLSIHAPDEDQSINCGGLFRHCVKLTTIEANGSGTTSLLKELTPSEPEKGVKGPSGGKGRKRKLDNEGVPAPVPTSNDATADTAEPIFPRLTSLFLMNLDFGEPTHCPGEPAHRHDVLYDALSTMLRRRRACKVPLKTLSTDYCIITTNRENALGKLVPELLGKRYRDESSLLDDFDDFLDCSYAGTEDQMGDYYVGSTQAE